MNVLIIKLYEITLIKMGLYVLHDTHEQHDMLSFYA